MFQQNAISLRLNYLATIILSLLKPLEYSLSKYLFENKQNKSKT